VSDGCEAIEKFLTKLRMQKKRFSSYTAKVIEILIASPSDVKEEREAAREILLDWNRKYTRRHKIVLLPRMWELDASTRLGSAGGSERTTRR